jgi:hypothetical protein
MYYYAISCEIAVSLLFKKYFEQINSRYPKILTEDHSYFTEKEEMAYRAILVVIALVARYGKDEDGHVGGMFAFTVWIAILFLTMTYFQIKKLISINNIVKDIKRSNGSNVNKLAL